MIFIILRMSFRLVLHAAGLGRGRAGEYRVWLCLRPGPEVQLRCFSIWFCTRYWRTYVLAKFMKMNLQKLDDLTGVPILPARLHVLILLAVPIFPIVPFLPSQCTFFGSGLANSLSRTMQLFQLCPFN